MDIQSQDVLQTQLQIADSQRQGLTFVRTQLNELIEEIFKFWIFFLVTTSGPWRLLALTIERGSRLLCELIAFLEHLDLLNCISEAPSLRIMKLETLNPASFVMFRRPMIFSKYAPCTHDSTSLGTSFDLVVRA